VSLDYMENGRSTTKEGILEKLIETVEKFDTNTIDGALASVFISLIKQIERTFSAKSDS
jgi:hypothetical protein